MTAAARLDRYVWDWLETASLEELLTHELAFGLTTASPLQRALCRIAEGTGLGLLAADPAVSLALGSQGGPIGRPRELAIVSGIRTGKSLFAACLAVYWALRCDVSRLGPGEVPRVSIVSLKRDLAAVVFGHLVGRLQESPMLSHALVEVTSDTVMVRHPSGREVEIAVVAGARAGGSLVGRWAAGVVFDEFARMLGSESEGVVNWGESRRVVLERLLPGAQIVHISSPWAPYGPAYDLVQAHWGRPTDRMVVVKAPAFDLNPDYWTPERVEAAKADEDVYRTDVLADFASAEEAFLSADAVARATRESAEPLPYDPTLSYTAAMDPAFRGNGWTLGLFTRRGNERIMVGAWEWIGSRENALKASEVFEDIAKLLTPYGVFGIDSDNYNIDTLREFAGDVGLSVTPWHHTEQQRTEMYLKVRTLLLEGKVSLPAVANVRTDLLRIKRKVTPSGIRIDLPLSSDGRHCDWGPTIMLGLSRYIDDADASALLPDAEKQRQAFVEAAIKRWQPKDDNDDF